MIHDVPERRYSSTLSKHPHCEEVKCSGAGPSSFSIRERVLVFSGQKQG